MTGDITTQAVIDQILGFVERGWTTVTTITADTTVQTIFGLAVGFLFLGYVVKKTGVFTPKG